MKQEELKKKIRCQHNSPDITEMELPIHADIGEGFTFEFRGKEYITKAAVSLSGDKREIFFDVKALSGIYAGKLRYCCEAVSFISFVTNSIEYSNVDDYFLKKKIPKEYNDLDFFITHPISLDEINTDRERWIGHKEGDPICVFTSKRDILKIIEELKEVFPQDEWEFVII